MGSFSIATLFYLALCQLGDGYRILAVFPLHGKSHSVMTHALTRGLAKRGHQVDVISHFPLKKPIPNYTDISIKGSVRDIENNMTYSEVTQFQTLNIRTLINILGNQVCELLALPQMQKLIQNPPTDPPYDLVIVEFIKSPCYLAFGKRLNVPVISVVASVLHDWFNYPVGNPLNPTYIPSVFSSFSQEMSFYERLTNAILIVSMISQVNYYMTTQDQMVSKYFGPDYPSVAEMQKTISLILVNSHPKLNGIRPMTPVVVEVGGLQLQEDESSLPMEIQSWLEDAVDGCIYFSFGSMVRIETFPEKTIKQFYEAFERIAPVRVLMKIAKIEELLPGLPKNVMVQPWFNQIAVLKHKNIKGFITHGGQMGIQEAVCHGVPMIGIPFFGEQNINVKNFAKMKVAVAFNSIQEVTSDRLVNDLNAILRDPVYRQNAKALAKLYMDRPMSAMDTAIYWIEYIGRHGATVLQSPVIKLAWWQRYMLDIYGLVLLCLFALLKVICYLTRKIIECLGEKRNQKRSSTYSKEKKH